MRCVFSLNVRVPGKVSRLADELHPTLVGFDRVREQHTLLCKRLGDPEPEEYPIIEGWVRRALSGLGPFAVRVDGLGYFTDPPAGPAPVVYLSVESPGLVAAHERLCEAPEASEPTEDLEGAEYVPHVTLARGGTLEDADALVERDIDPVEWTVNELVFWNRSHGGEAGRIRLPV